MVKRELFRQKNLNFKIYFVVFYFLFSLASAKQKSQIYARFKTVKCSMTSKTFNANYTCSIKPYNRYIAKLNVLLHFDVLTHQIIVSFVTKISNFFFVVFVNFFVVFVNFLKILGNFQKFFQFLSNFKYFPSFVSSTQQSCISNQQAQLIVSLSTKLSTFAII